MLELSEDLKTKLDQNESCSSRSKLSLSVDTTFLNDISISSSDTDAESNPDVTQNLNNSTLVDISNTHELNHFKLVPVYQWNLTFNGGKSKTDMSLNAFLERVDELCESRNISKAQLFTSAGIYFRAPHWAPNL